MATKDLIAVRESAQKILLENQGELPTRGLVERLKSKFKAQIDTASNDLIDMGLVQIFNQVAPKKDKSRSNTENSSLFPDLRLPDNLSVSEGNGSRRKSLKKQFDNATIDEIREWNLGRSNPKAPSKSLLKQCDAMAAILDKAPRGDMTFSELREFIKNSPP